MATPMCDGRVTVVASKEGHDCDGMVWCVAGMFCFRSAPGSCKCPWLVIYSGRPGCDQIAHINRRQHLIDATTAVRKTSQLFGPSNLFVVVSRGPVEPSTDLLSTRGGLYTLLPRSFFYGTYIRHLLFNTILCIKSTVLFTHHTFIYSFLYQICSFHRSFIYYFI